MNLLSEYHIIFMLEDGEMRCTAAAEHKIKVTDPRPFKERPQNIPSGLLNEVKEHLDHMLDMGAIKSSKSAWCNAVVLVQKKDGGLRFCINFQKLNARTQKDAFPFPKYMMPLMPSVEASITPLSISFLDFGKPPWKSLPSNIQLSLWGH